MIDEGHSFAQGLFFILIYVSHFIAVGKEYIIA